MMDEVLAALKLADTMAEKALKLKEELHQAKQLLKEAVEFMNLVPIKLITFKGELDLEDLFGDESTIDHYKLCSKIDEFLKEK